MWVRACRNTAPDAARPRGGPDPGPLTPPEPTRSPASAGGRGRGAAPPDAVPRFPIVFGGNRPEFACLCARIRSESCGICLVCDPRGVCAALAVRGVQANAETDGFQGAGRACVKRHGAQLRFGTRGGCDALWDLGSASNGILFLVWEASSSSVDPVHGWSTHRLAGCDSGRSLRRPG